MAMISRLNPEQKATLAYWTVSKSWEGTGETLSVGKALKLLREAKLSVGPHRPIYWKLQALSIDICQNQDIDDHIDIGCQ